MKTKRQLQWLPEPQRLCRVGGRVSRIGGRAAVCFVEKLVTETPDESHAGWSREKRPSGSGLYGHESVEQFEKLE